MESVTGKPIMATVAFRIPLSDYERALRLARQRGYRTLSPLLRPLMVEALARAEQQGDNGRGGNDHEYQA